jgi:hypothetical protein
VTGYAQSDLRQSYCFPPIDLRDLAFIEKGCLDAFVAALQAGQS